MQPNKSINNIKKKKRRRDVGSMLTAHYGTQLMYANYSLWNSTEVFKTFEVFTKYSCFVQLCKIQIKTSVYLLVY